MDDHTCCEMQNSKKLIMDFLTREIEQMNVNMMPTRTIRDALFNKDNIKMIP